MMTLRTWSAVLKQSHLRSVLLYSILIFSLVVCFITSMWIGPVPVELNELLVNLFTDATNTKALVVQQIRLPRTLLGMMVGATLGLAGASLQGYLRNPLAEPGLIGVSATAALGAVLAFYSGLSSQYALALPICGMVGASVGMVIVVILAGRNTSSLTLILAGIAVTSFATALTSLALNLAPNPYAVLEIVFWMMGSLADRSLEHVWLVAPFMGLGWLLLLSLARPLNALSLGEDTAQTLGFNLRGVRYRLMVGMSLSVGAATSVAGMIGFVGLVVPHLLRSLVGHRPGTLLAISALGGALLTMLADIVVRWLSSTQEIKLGVVTALVGAPFFLFLIAKLRKQLL